MNPALKIAKAALPAGLRRFLRTRHREFVWWRAMRSFLRDPKAAVAANSRVISDLVYGWGNDSWSALEEYLVACVKGALAATGPILECGSGLSTVVVGVVAQRSGQILWSLEHDEAWSGRVNKYLQKYQIDSVRLCTNPLKDFADFSWYNPPLGAMPDSFALVICDGPPGDTPGGRYGLVPIMWGRLKTGCIILLDDVWRAEERAIAQRWGVELPARYETFGDRKPYVRMVVEDGNGGHAA